MFRDYDFSWLYNIHEWIDWQYILFNPFNLNAQQTLEIKLAISTRLLINSQSLLLCLGVATIYKASTGVPPMCARTYNR